MGLLSELIRTAPLVHPDPGWRDALSRMKYILRGVAFPQSTQEWFQLLRTPQLALLARNHPHVLSKLQRPYLNRTLGPRQRLETLKHHYHFVTEHFPVAMIEDIFSPGGFPLATIPMARVGHFRLRLGYGFEKEGDLTIRLQEEGSGVGLFFLTFCISRSRAGTSEIFIGGLQGWKQPNGKERIIAVTRAMHGLRPKALLVFAVQQLASLWGITSIRAVSDATHVYRHYRKRKTLAARYDPFWQECGGELSADGMFTLPAAFVPRQPSVIGATKRQMYKRRYAMLAEVAGQIRAAVSCSTALSPAARICH